MPDGTDAEAVKEVVPSSHTGKGLVTVGTAGAGSIFRVTLTRAGLGQVPMIASAHQITVLGVEIVGGLT